jgi:hypothetical protein
LKLVWLVQGKGAREATSREGKIYTKKCKKQQFRYRETMTMPKSDSPNAKLELTGHAILAIMATT